VPNFLGCVSGKPRGTVSCQVTCKCQCEGRLFSCFVMKCAVSVDASCATISSTYFLVYFVLCNYNYADDKMPYSNVLSVFLMFRDKQDLVPLVFCLTFWHQSFTFKF
jgi:hypothetical protein